MRSLIMREHFLVFGSPIIEQPEIDEVVVSLKSGWLGTGPKVAQFEEEFRNYKSVGSISTNIFKETNFNCGTCVRIAPRPVHCKHRGKIHSSEILYQKYSKWQI